VGSFQGYQVRRRELDTRQLSGAQGKWNFGVGADPSKKGRGNESRRHGRGSRGKFGHRLEDVCSKYRPEERKSRPKIMHALGVNKIGEQKGRIGGASKHERSMDEAKPGRKQHQGERSKFQQSVR